MSIVKEIFKNLNESVEVKKPYGDKPEEGKKEKLQKGNRVNVPKAKGNFEKYRARKLEAKNKNAETIYANDTDKVMDKIDSNVHSDKGTIAKVNTKKADRKVKFPFGDKVQKSDSKLIKECDGAECEKKELKEDAYSVGAGILKEIYNQYVGLGMEDEFFEDCYNKMNISEGELQAWLEMGECSKVKCDNKLKEGYHSEKDIERQEEKDATYWADPDRENAGTEAPDVARILTVYEPFNTGELDTNIIDINDKHLVATSNPDGIKVRVYRDNEKIGEENLDFNKLRKLLK